MSEPTFIDEIEADAMVVAKRLMLTRDAVLAALAPDGRGFNEEKATERERLDDYVKNFRGNPEAQQQWIANEALRMTAAIQGVKPELVAALHPWDLAVRLALKYSVTMERIARREEAKANGIG